MKLKRLVIVGAGAIGGSVGGLLADSGHPVVLVARGQHARQIEASGLVVRLPDRTLHLRPHVVTRIDKVDWQDGDVAMLATKLQDARSLTNELADHVGQRLPVACANNGIHAERWAAERFENVISMLVWMPATHLKPGEVLLHATPCPGVLDNGPVQGGDAPAVSQQLCLWLRDVGFEAISRVDIQRWKYAKWLTNLGSAAQAMVTDDWMAVADAARSEGEAVLAAAGVARVSVQELLDRCAVVNQISIDGLEREGGSTWQSFQRGTPMETPWIEGAMADLADEFAVSAPVNRLLTELSQKPEHLTATTFWQIIAHRATDKHPGR